jgi:hypothetical protein
MRHPANIDPRTPLPRFPDPAVRTRWRSRRKVPATFQEPRRLEAPNDFEARDNAPLSQQNGLDAQHRPRTALPGFSDALASASINRGRSARGNGVGVSSRVSPSDVCMTRRFRNLPASLPTRTPNAHDRRLEARSPRFRLTLDDRRPTRRSPCGGEKPEPGSKSAAKSKL